MPELQHYTGTGIASGKHSLVSAAVHVRTQIYDKLEAEYIFFVSLC